MRAIRTNGKLSGNWSSQWISPERARSQIGRFEKQELSRWSRHEQVHFIKREENFVGQTESGIRKGVYTHIRAVIVEGIYFVRCRGPVHKGFRTRRDDWRCFGGRTRWLAKIQLDRIEGIYIRGRVLRVFDSSPALKLRVRNWPVHVESGICNDWGKTRVKRSGFSNWGHTFIPCLVCVHLTISSCGIVRVLADIQAKVEGIIHVVKGRSAQIIA